MKSKDYRGYSSFSYLSPHVDYRVFDMAEERGRVPVHNLGLSEDQEARAQQLLAENIVISLHDHPFRLPARPHELAEYQKEAHVAIGYEGLSRSGLDAVFDNIGGPAWSWEATIKDLGMRLCDIAHQNMVHIAYSIDCIRKAHNTGKIAFVLGLEGAEVIGDDIDRIDILYGLGIRQMGIVYEKENSFGYGLHAVEDRGLTELGRRAVRRMNQLGMVIDLSHAGDRTSLDVIEESEFPVLISHAGAREVWNTRRMKSDEVIKACAANGGLIGIEAAPHTTISPRNPRHNIESVMDHFQYCIDLVGSSHVTFGPDTFFGDHVGLHNCLNEKLGLDAFFAAGPKFERIEYVSGLENPAECFPNIVRWLVFNGYSDDQIAEVVGGNTMRILDLIWKVAP
ncbi:dipeptidase [Streptomyces capillispiralis]|uniref:dipeptidase n=1 Tax=Streptomyces capillispiralis TaxID=68182 RepID=UPI0036C018E3